MDADSRKQINAQGSTDCNGSSGIFSQFLVKQLFFFFFSLPIIHQIPVL